MHSRNVLLVAGGAAATSLSSNSSSGLATNPGGALPATLQAPSIAGFENATVHPSRGGLGVCVSGMIPVTATANNAKFNFTVPTNQTQTTEAFVDMITSGSPFTKQIMGGMQSVNGTYRIGATLCVPASNASPSTVEILTHGIGFDRSYWDFAPGYSYVDVSIKNGHAAFFYDRLSVGKSQKTDSLNTTQASLEVEIANQLASKLRQGGFSNKNFSKVVGAGHSFGSVITQAVTARYPKALDAAILTGFSVNSTAMPLFISSLNLVIANLNNPLRFANLPIGYLVSDTSVSNQIGFFRAPGFDPEVLAASEATKGTVTYGELFSISAVSMPASNYTGPLAVVNGANDLPFCFGNCSYPTNLAAAVKPMLYANLNASKFDTYLAPVTGHGLNLHYSATATYTWIQSFLSKQGI